ncbi:MAG: hypothetical protein V4719_09290 [Planctomycetota bacterium]
MRNLLFIGFYVACSVLSAGCGGKQVAREPVFPVAGKIVYNGQPVASADVTFFCAEKDRSAFGRTNDKGEFKLTTFNPNDGAVPGKHVVIVTKIQITPAVKLAETSNTNYVPPGTNRSTDLAPPKNSIPAKYGDAKTSDLIAIINADGKNSEMTLELKD